MISLSLSRLHRGLAILLALLGVLSVGGETWYHHSDGQSALAVTVLESLNLTKETNLTTWFQAGTLVWASFLCTLLARRQPKFGGPWWVTATLLFLMGLDEVASVHERTVPFFRLLLGGKGLFLFTWVVPGMAMALLMLVGLVRFAATLPRSSGRPMLEGTVIFFTGALGLEMLGGLLASGDGFKGLPYFYIATLEELFETAGVLRFLVGLVDQLGERPLTLSTSSRAGAVGYGVAGIGMALATVVLELGNHYQGSPSGFMVELAQFFNITQERNLATYLSSLALASIAWGCWIVSKVGRDHSFAWKGLSGLTLFLSVDEIATLHERAEALILLEWNPPVLLTRAWIVLAPLLLLPLLRWAWRCGESVPESSQPLWLLGWLGFLAGTVLLKPVSGWLAVQSGWQVSYFLLAVAEDALKIAGCCLLLWSVQDTVQQEKDPLTLTFV